MQLQFSAELLQLLQRNQQKELASWILNNTKTGQHIMQLQVQSTTFKVIKSEQVTDLMHDLRVIGSILPVLLKLRLLP